MNKHGSGCTHSARAMRLVLAVVGNDPEAYEATLAEADDCPDCLRLLVRALAQFSADRIKRSPAPDRWERWLTQYIAQLLDAAQQADA
jgi:hypothetical protein